VPKARTVLVTGCFDPFHIGHLYHLQAARVLGDPLIVAIMKDGYVQQGKHRPMFGQEERVAVLRAIAIVDDVILVEHPIDALAELKPAIWCIGIEYKNRVSPEDASYCRANSIELAYTNKKTYASTKICNLLRQDFGALLNG
jgi:cytidyltransferase-like protein